MKSAPALDFLPSHRQSYPEVCLVGPVNSGKSEIIRAISGSSTMARSSSKSGNTGTIRFFCVGDAFMIADATGYGTWTKGGKFSRSKRLCGHAFVRQYLSARSNLKMAYFVLDSSKQPSCLTTRDKEYYAWMCAEKIPVTVVASKIDNIAPASVRGVYELISSELGRIEESTGLPHRDKETMPFLEISARTGHGIQNLMRDMVYNAACDLQDENLTISDMKRLSYTPMTSAEQIAVESKYLPEAHNLPLSDEAPFPQWILQPNVNQAQVPGLGGGKSFYFSLDKPKCIAANKVDEAKTAIDVRSADVLQKAVSGIYARSPIDLSKMQTTKLPDPNIANFLSRCPGSFEHYFAENMSSLRGAIEPSLVHKSELFSDKEKKTKRQRRLTFMRKCVLREHHKPTNFVSPRLHYPFMSDSEALQGPSRMVAGLKQGDHQKLFGPATLQRR